MSFPESPLTWGDMRGQWHGMPCDVAARAMHHPCLNTEHGPERLCLGSPAEVPQEELECMPLSRTLRDDVDVRASCKCTGIYNAAHPLA